MITLPNGKICMNEQEAIQWLLDNYPIPFQCSANYVGGAEIGLGTIVNPTPAKVKVGSIIFFADSKVSTVVAVNSNSFICSDQYNDLVDDVVYVSNVQLNASGHLIVTLSNNTTIDAGLIKQVSNFSINASQHLIVSYNDGSSADLGAIFNGNVNIAGNFTADSIIENMSGYSFSSSSTDSSVTLDYVGVVKTGNKITFVIAGKFEFDSTVVVGSYKQLGSFTIPSEIGAKIYPNMGSGRVGPTSVQIAVSVQSSETHMGFFAKYSNSIFAPYFSAQSAISAGTYYFRFEQTFLLSDNLAA